METPARLRRVVLIDDNETTNFLNKHLLNKLGVTNEVLVFADASEGYRYLWGEGRREADTGDPELVFVDLRMPGMDGVEFMEAWQALDPARRGATKLAVLTTSLLPTDRDRVARFPGVEYLVKPLSREKLERLLAEHFPHVRVPAPSQAN